MVYWETTIENHINIAWELVLIYQSTTNYVLICLCKHTGNQQWKIWPEVGSSLLLNKQEMTVKNNSSNKFVQLQQQQQQQYPVYSHKYQLWEYIFIQKNMEMSIVFSGYHLLVTEQIHCKHTPSMSLMLPSQN